MLLSVVNVTITEISTDNVVVVVILILINKRLFCHRETETWVVTAW